VTADLPTVTLDAVPGLGALYARGLGSSAVAKVRRSPGPTTLPELAVRVAGLDTGAPAVRERLAAYDRLLGEPAADTLPAGFVHVLAFPVATALMVRDDFPLPLLGMVHLANAVEVRRPVVVGDALEVRAWAEALRPHPRGTQVDLVTEVSTGPGDEPAWRGVSTYLAKGTYLAPPELLTDPRLSEPGPGMAGPRSDNSGSEGWRPPLPTERWVLDAGTGRRYAGISGDRNPIHLSALSARAFGFPRAIAHGMYTASRALASVARERGDAYDWTVTFARPVLLPGTVDVSVRPAGVPGAGDAGWSYDGWDAREGARHFAGTVVPR
jgi:acyl dehydratase